jgi:hypothetical protein
LGPAPVSNNANNNTPAPHLPTTILIPNIPNNGNIKKVLFDGNEASLYLWTTQILVYAETYTCEQAPQETITVPPY